MSEIENHPRFERTRRVNFLKTGPARAGLGATALTKATLHSLLEGFSSLNLPNILGDNFSTSTFFPGRLISESKIWWEFPFKQISPDDLEVNGVKWNKADKLPYPTRIWTWDPLLLVIVHRETRIYNVNWTIIIYGSYQCVWSALHCM